MASKFFELSLSNSIFIKMQYFQNKDRKLFSELFKHKVNLLKFKVIIKSEQYHKI